tara:strand:- start:2329 stop:3483 length:1155 start_codon:yes stop_codon:yes gene_type:complete
MALETVNGVACANIQSINNVAKADAQAVNSAGTCAAAGASYSIVWLAVGEDGRAATSTDGQNWTEGQLGHQNTTGHRGIAFGNTGSYDEGCWAIAKGGNTMEALWTFNKTPIVATDSSASWQSANFAGNRSCRSVLYDEKNGYFMFGAKSLSAAKTIPTASISDLAQNWPGCGDSGSYSDYSDASADKGHILAMGSDGAGNNMVGIIDEDLILGQLTGDGGTRYNWTQVSGSKFLQTGQSRNISGVAYGNGIWVIAGAFGKMKRSTDNGSTWEDITTGTSNNIQHVAYGGAGDSTANVWMFVGGSGDLYRSTDGAASWTELDPGHNIQMSGIASDGSGSWVAVGNAGKFGYSGDDGATWTFGTASHNVDWYAVAINRMLPLDAG